MAGRHGDGLWTLPDPESTPEVIDAFREARAKAGHDGPGEAVFQALVSWAESDEAALESVRKWKGAQPDDHYTADWHEPDAMYRHGEREISDGDRRAEQLGRRSARRDPHLRRARAPRAEGLRRAIASDR